MKLVICSFLLVLSYVTASTKIDSKELKCLVCQQSIEELSKAVSELDPSKHVDVGGYRLDADGNYKHKTVSQSKSELKISELIENVCNKMDDFVRATEKDTGKLILFRLIGEDGKMNPRMSEVDLIQDDDLNKSVKYNCETIMEEHEDEIIVQYQNDSKDITEKICLELTGYCKTLLPKEDL